MNKSESNNSSGRVRLPEEVDGDFTGLIIGTFGAQLDFAEMQFFRQLSKSTVNRVVLADQRQLNSYLSTQPALRRLNRSYIAAPVTSPRAHHPKYIMLIGLDEGRLFVGSGNLSISGYAGPGECFTAYEWHADDPGSNPAPFGAVRELIGAISKAGWVDAVAIERIEDAFKAAPWVPETGGPGCTVVHNQERPLLDQLVERVGGADVIEIVATAPFHDRNADAMRQIIKKLKPNKVVLLVQEGMTRLDTRALGSALSTVQEVEIQEASAPHPYPQVLLHAKFVLVRTKAKDVLLQGSANLSSVALCAYGSNANVEIANLLVGNQGQFDLLLDSLDLRLRSGGLATFAADEDWGDGVDDESLVVGPTNVAWAAPTLSGQIPLSMAQNLKVRIGEREVVPKIISWATIDGFHHFIMEFDETDSSRIENSRFIEMVNSSVHSWTVYPYFVHSLSRLTASGSRADLLQAAGDLDLRDKELEELVVELDRVLIVDGRSLWRLANLASPEPDDTDDEELKLDYEQLDWDKIGALPQMRQYGLAEHRALLAPTELGLLLHSLTNRFRIDAREVAVLEPDDDTGDLGKEPEFENPDDIDDASGQDNDDDGDGKPLMPRQRVRRLWRNFINRFIRGLSDEEFIRSVGSSVVIPSYVVFNLLCRRLRVVDLVDADFLVDAQTKLWTFMWGDGDESGYLSRLSAEEMVVAQKILSDHDDLPVTLSAIDDAWWHVWENGADVTGLRTACRSFLSSEFWGPEKKTLHLAATASIRCDGDSEQLYEDLYSLGAHVEEGELLRVLASNIGVSSHQIHVVSDIVMRSAIPFNCKLFRVEGIEISIGQAKEALEIWRQLDPEADYLRLQSDVTTAVVDLVADDGFFFNRVSGIEEPLTLGDGIIPTWERRLEFLHELAS